MATVRPIGLLPICLSLLSAQSSYVDPKLCAACHAGIAQTYAKTGMARSFSEPAADAITPAEPFHHAASATWYSTTQHDGHLYQRRWRIGYDGSPIDLRELSIDYIMGSGNHARTYLHRTGRGTLQELPLAWYSENGGQWAMSPGHDLDHTIPTRTVAYECMFCHNAYPRIPPGHDEPGSEAIYLGALPQGIDCQRCHGPGSDHVRAAQAPNVGADAIRRAIVNPARLSPDRQMEVCLQCHLETTSRPLPHSIFKYDRAPFSYRPGQPLGDFMLFFDRAPSASRDDFEIVHSAYRLRQSQCFLRSQGKLTCTTCHNPHDVPRGVEAAQHYNQVCQGCHSDLAAGTHTADPDCVNCHMPKRRTQDAVHVVMTDHFIRRRPPPHDPSAPLAEKPDADAYSGPVVQYYPKPAPENALYLDVAQASQRGNPAALQRFAADLAARKTVHPQFYSELGQALLAAGKPAAAVTAFEEAVRRRPESAATSLVMADALTQAGQFTRAVTLLNRALTTSAADPLLWYQLGISQSAADNQQQAIAAWEKSLSLDPDLVEAHTLLGAALAAAGDLERSEKEFRTALQLNPDYPEAQAHLGHLLAMRRQLPEAAFFLSRAAQLTPADAEVRTNYAVTLAGLNRFDEAQRQIDVAVKADPKSADAHNFRGTLLEHGGKLPEALAEFLEAARLQPAFARAQWNAGRLLAAKGDTAAAIPHLRQAVQSGDPVIQRQAADALRSLGSHQ